MADISVSVQVKFTEQTKYGSFTDALYFSPDEFSTISQDDIKALIKNRVDNYISVVETPTQDVEPSKAELQESRAELAAQIAELDSQIAKKG